MKSTTVFRDTHILIRTFFREVTVDEGVTRVRVAVPLTTKFKRVVVAV